MDDSKPQDTLYRQREGLSGDFVFDAAVAAVFPDMISRSVPGYAAILNMIELLAGRYAQPGSRLYDLGCALGASTVALARGAAGTGCRSIGIANAPAMLHTAADYGGGDEMAIEWLCRDVRDVEIEDASIVVLNFTLQFLPTAQRLALLRRIREGLRDGGILILSDKIRGEDPAADQRLVDMHHAFKQANGYSTLEISRKRTALENVLVPETLDTHRQRLADAGFAVCDLWFQCFNFVSLVAHR